MTRYLMAISIGPVQGFIAAARRTRDFWMGSTILSECAKAVARWIVQPAENGPVELTRLVFPSPQDLNDLLPWDFNPERETPLSDFSVPNVVLACIETDIPPADFAAQARQRVIDRWQVFVERTLSYQMRDSEGQRRSVESDLDQEQLKLQKACPEDFFEFFSAWVPLGDEKGYGEARRRVMRLLGGRKSCRSFAPWQGTPGKPKSSLDGARESVLKPAGQRLLPLRVREQEQLDLLGLVKRLDFGNDAIRFPSVSRLAADPFIRGLLASADTRGQLERIRVHCEKLVTLDALRKRQDSSKQPKEDDVVKFSWLRSFPFEGTPLYVNRHQELLLEHPDYSSEEGTPRHERWMGLKGSIEQELKGIVGCLDTVKKACGEPDPYFAVLCADGDRMGAAISTLAKHNAVAQHQAFSAAQTKFADEARKRVNSPYHGAEHVPENERFRGAMVFAGGDDLLAFLPLDQCLDCAAVLHKLFEDCLRERLTRKSLADLEAHGCLPTLSVGVAIGHFLEPLEDLLEYVYQAEHRAKNASDAEIARGQSDRSALAITVCPRSGASFTVRDNWDRGIVERLQGWTDLYRGKALSRKAAYDLREVARNYEKPWKDGAAMQSAIRGHAIQVLERKGGRAASEEKNRKEFDRLIRDPESGRGVKTGKDLAALACELLVGQRIAGAKEQAAGSKNPDETDKEAMK